MSSNHIQRITIVGAGGTIGSYFANALIDQGKHAVNAVTRPSSHTPLPQGFTEVHRISYDDHAGLVNALKLQDVLIITLAVGAGHDAQKRLIDAAVEAGVPWIMPNEYGGDMYTDPSIGKDTLVGEKGTEIREYIEAASEKKTGGKTKWVALMCGFWYEFSLAGTEARYGFDFDAKKAVFFDDGDEKQSTSTWLLCGEAVAKLFALPIQPHRERELSLSDFANKHVPIASFTVSQREMFASLLRVTGDSESDWTVVHEESKARYERGKDMFTTTGNIVGFAILLYTRMFFRGAGSHAERCVNDALGLTKEGLDERTRAALELHTSGFFQQRRVARSHAAFEIS